MSKTDKPNWNETNRKHSWLMNKNDVLPKEDLNPKLVPKKSVTRVPYKDLPIHMKYPRAFQCIILGVAGLILFSKPIYETYLHYTGQKPLKRSDIQLHPFHRKRDGVSGQSSLSNAQVSEVDSRV